MSKLAFTLVEIIIVVAIIAIIASVAIPNLIRAKISANDAIAQSVLKNVASALENYVINNGQYPADMAELVGATPPYLSRDYFSGTHAGFTYGQTLNAANYTISAVPITIGVSGSTVYTVSAISDLQ